MLGGVAGRTRTFAADSVVLATGGLSVGGIVLDRTRGPRETVFGLDLAGVPEDGPFVADVHAENPIDRTGVAIDDGLRPLSRVGRRRPPQPVCGRGHPGRRRAVARAVGQRPRIRVRIRRGGVATLRRWANA